MESASSSQEHQLVPSLADASRRRIARAGPRWQQVLGCKVSASIDDIKHAFKRLAVLHHPDKSGDPETFKRIREAYEEGLIKTQCSLARKAKAAAKQKAQKKKEARAKQKAKKEAEKRDQVASKRVASAQELPQPKRPAFSEATAGTAPTSDISTAMPSEKQVPVQKLAGDCTSPVGNPSEQTVGNGCGSHKAPWPKPVSISAPVADIRSAIRSWQASLDLRKKTMPDDIPMITPETLQMWIRQGTVVAVDVREAADRVGPAIPDAIHLSYLQLTLESAKAIPIISKLRDDDRVLVFFSQRAERMAMCGALSALLLDVFEFPAKRLVRLEGGFHGWRHWVESDPLMRAEEKLSVALEAKHDAYQRLATTRQEYDLIQSATDQAGSLQTGSWEGDLNALSRSLAKGHFQLRSQQANEEPLAAAFEFALKKAPALRAPFESLIVDELEERLRKRLETLDAEFRNRQDEAVDSLVKAEIAASVAEHLAASAEHAGIGNNKAEDAAKETVMIDIETSSNTLDDIDLNPQQEATGVVLESAQMPRSWTSALLKHTLQAITPVFPRKQLGA